MTALIQILVLTIFICSCAPKVENKNFYHTIWYSPELQYSNSDRPINNLVLSFAEETVDFDTPGDKGYLASLLLDVRDVTIPNHYTWKYSANEKEIILDPGLTGYNIHLEISGDSLIWRGKMPPIGRDYISLKKTGPVERLK